MFVPYSELAQFLIHGQTEPVAVTGGEDYVGEGRPFVFAEGAGDGFFEVEGELFEGGVVLVVRRGWD